MLHLWRLFIHCVSFLLNQVLVRGLLQKKALDEEGVQESQKSSKRTDMVASKSCPLYENISSDLKNLQKKRNE